VAGDVGLGRLCRALRDGAVFAASLERRPWRLSREEAADQIEVNLVPHGDVATLSWTFTMLGVSGGTEVEWPIDLNIVLTALVDQIGDIGAEFWRVALAPCDSVQDGCRCELPAGHSGRHRTQGPGGSLRWGSRNS